MTWAWHSSAPACFLSFLTFSVYSHAWRWRFTPTDYWKSSRFHALWGLWEVGGGTATIAHDRISFTALWWYSGWQVTLSQIFQVICRGNFLTLAPFSIQITFCKRHLFPLHYPSPLVTQCSLHMAMMANISILVMSTTAYQEEHWYLHKLPPGFRNDPRKLLLGLKNIKKQLV